MFLIVLLTRVCTYLIWLCICIIIQVHVPIFMRDMYPLNVSVNLMNLPFVSSACVRMCVLKLPSQILHGSMWRIYILYIYFLSLSLLLLHVILYESLAQMNEVIKNDFFWMPDTKRTKDITNVKLISFRLQTSISWKLKH